MPIPTVLSDMLALPTAAFVEQAVLDYIRGVCQKLPGVTIRADEHGNLVARYRKGRGGRRAPLVFTAHTDHPGFVAREMLDAKTLLADFRGWVESAFFLGTKVRFWNGRSWIRGAVTKIEREAKIYGMIGRTARPEQVLVRIGAAVAANSPGMWDLPDPKLRGDHVFARGCDDLAGAAALLALLERLSAGSAAADVICLFTRAEEVGFVGAIGAAKSGSIPKSSAVVAIETSKALPTAPIGAGPILRVGDKSSVFSPGVTAFCDRVGKELAERDKNFKFQRKLMDGGTCESTAYLAYGFAATGICVALGNYHNMNADTQKIESEYISLSDWERMVDWFEALSLDGRGPADEMTKIREGLEKRFAEHRPLLAPAAAASRGRARAATRGRR